MLFEYYRNNSFIICTEKYYFGDKLNVSLTN